MSSLRSLAPGGKLPDTTEFTSAQAEELMRRAIQLHDRQTEAVSPEILRQTLESMDVAPDALKQAAMELRAELAGPSLATTPGQVIGDLVLFLLCAWPGITLIAYRNQMEMDPWIPGGVGVLLLALVVRSWIRSLKRQYRVHALTGGQPTEAVP